MFCSYNWNLNSILNENDVDILSFMHFPFVIFIYVFTIMKKAHGFPKSQQKLLPHGVHPENRTTRTVH